MSALNWHDEDPLGVFQAGSVFPGRPQQCPNCGGPDPQAVVEGGEVHFLCKVCGVRTFVQHGYLWTMAPPPV